MNESSDIAEYEELATSISAKLALQMAGLVGSGAFKHTFRVKTQDGISKALKIYKSGANARTDREVDAIRRCSHPGVAQFENIDTWVTGSRSILYSLEEFLDGGTFTALIEQGLLSRIDTRLYALQLVDALAHLADLGLVHRDIKPDNIMLRGNAGKVVLVDFGLVRDLSKSSLTKTWAPHGPGTPYYSSPEQLNNEKDLIGWRSDQFSLGVVLAEASFGRHPFLPANAEPWVAVDAVAQRKPPTDDFQTWAESNHPTLSKMLSPWPVGRYRTPKALLDAWQKEEC